MSGPGRIDALDGLRGVAVALVLGFHTRLSGFEGGFLGVDLFFVVSGFIITLRLLEEHRRTGTIDLAAFYTRRLWRLYPAMLLLILVCVPVTALVAGDALRRLVEDAPAAFLYLANWWQLWSSQSYFEAMGREPVLRHLWSLAVEQHYYLLWPAVMVGVLRMAGPAWLGCLALVLALGSTLEMYRLYEEDPRNANFTYLATHTHAMGLFVGSALGCLVARAGVLGVQASRRASAVMKWAMGTLGLLALMCLALTVHQWNEGTPWLYKGGFLLVSCLGALALGAVAVGAGPVCRALSVAPLRWMGTRSYSIYLWHWPVCVWVFDGPGDADPSGIGAITIVLISFVLGEASYRLVELRSQGAVRFVRRSLGPAFGPVGLWLAAGSALIAARVLAPEWPAESKAATPEPAEVQASAPPTRATDLLAVDTAPAPAQAASQPDAPAVPTPGAQADSRPVVVIGDSVALGAAPYLVRSLPGTSVDAMVGRQMSELPRILKETRARLASCPHFVIHLGTNGYIAESQLRAALRTLEDCERVVLVDVYGARRWIEKNSEIISSVVSDFPNVRLVPWNDMGQRNPHFFVKDGIHLSGPGIDALARGIAQALDRTLVTSPPSRSPSRAQRAGARAEAARPGASAPAAPPAAEVTGDGPPGASPPKTDPQEP